MNIKIFLLFPSKHHEKYTKLASLLYRSNTHAQILRNQKDRHSIWLNLPINSVKSSRISRMRLQSIDPTNLETWNSS